MEASRATLLLFSALALASPGCVGSGPHEARPPRQHALPEDDAYDRHDFPEATMRAPREPGTTQDLAPATADARPEVRLELSVVDVIDWDQVHVRGGIRGSVVRGIVSLTGWLDPKTKGRAPAPAQSVVVATGHEAELALADPALRDLVGSYAVLRVAVLEASDRGSVDVAVDPLVTPDSDGQLTLASRVRVTPGEALVLGGHRSDPEEPAPAPGTKPAAPRARDQLVILTATVLPSRRSRP